LGRCGGGTAAGDAVGPAGAALSARQIDGLIGAALFAIAAVVGASYVRLVTDAGGYKLVP